VQSASVNFVQAATGAGGTWAEPQLFADWQGNGAASRTTPGTIPLFVRDSFDDRVTIASWGHTKNGQAWTVSGGAGASDFFIRDGIGVQAQNAVNQLHFSTIDLGSTDFDIISDVIIPVFPTGAGISGRIVGRLTDTSNYYEGQIFAQTSGVVLLALTKRVAGVGTTITSVSAGTHAADTVWRIRFQGMGSTFRAKLWNRDTQEQPLEWTITTTDSALTTGTNVGFASRLETGNTNTQPVNLAISDFRALAPGTENLSPQLGDWSVEHHLDDGYPNAATFIAGIGVGQLDADIGPPPVYVAGKPMTVSEYFSPYNDESPLYGLDRDVAPVTLDQGLVTAAGVERVRVFTGQMMDIPVRRGQASLSAISAARLKLKALVQPPSAYGLYQGANATWAITYALHKCGIYAGPPPQDGCRLWVPFHGSVRAFIPETNIGVDLLAIVGDGPSGVGAGVGPLRSHIPRWVPGPYVIGAGSAYTSEWIQLVSQNSAAPGVYLEPGIGLTLQDSKGKIELWIRGDDTFINAVPGASGTVVSTFRCILGNENGTGVDVGILSSPSASLRKPFIALDDNVVGGNTYSTAFPTDGEWHFVGYSWDIAAGVSKINVDGVVETFTPGITVGNYPTMEDWAEDRPFIGSSLPTSELQITAGVYADGITGQWLLDIPFTPDAIVTPSVIELASIAEKFPREAWELIGSYAQAELASMRTNETDVFEYLGLDWWVQDQQQIIVDTLSTDENSGTLDINIDPTKIYNSIQVAYGESANQDTFQLVFTTQEVLTIRPGFTTLILSFDPTATEVRGFTFTNIADADTVEPTDTNTISVNDSSDGTGSYATSAQVSAVISEWNPGSVSVIITNTSGFDWYTANDKGWPTLTIGAKALITRSASVVERNTAGIARRGERSLTVSAPAIQSRYDARRLALRLLSALRKPTPVADEIEVFGDPRRQPGDLVTMADPTATKASGQWRVQSITHQSRNSEYTQRIRIRPALGIGIVGTSRVGQCLVGPEE
jgi:hypothetical protein